jgi:hypothetical protein
MNPLQIPTLERSENIEQLSDHTDEHEWNDNIESVLKKISINCCQEAEICKKNYVLLIEKQKYFSIPVILISGLNSIFAVGLSSYLNQPTVSILNCLLSFFVSAIQSVSLYLNINKFIDLNMTSYKNFYLLAMKINNILSLKRHQRTESNANIFLNECLSSYESYFNTMNITNDKIDDRLIENEIKKIRV